MANPNPTRPKRKKASSASRKARGNKNKRSRYNYAGARDALSLPSDATAQEIAFNVTPAGTTSTSGGDRSPLKKEYKAMLLEERSKNELLAKKVEDSVQHIHLKERKISNLKMEVRQLSAALRSEKEKSRITILKLLDDAEDVIAEATALKENTNEKMSAAELAILREKEKSQNAIRREREYTSYTITSRKFKRNDMFIIHNIVTHIIIFLLH